MFDRYRKRLAADLDRWIAAGLVPERSRAAILDDIAPEPARWSAQGAAAILGAVLLALAALSFVAANWSELTRAARFGAILAALWLSYGGAIFAFSRNDKAVGHALALLGAALFGGAILLTAQTFNLSAMRNTGLLIWTVGALVTALAIPSRPVLILSAVLAMGWMISETQNPLAPAILWSYPALFAVGAAAASHLRSRVAMNLLALSLGGWLLHTLGEAAMGGGLGDAAAAVCFALICGALALGAGRLRDHRVPGAGILAGWGAAGAAAGAFMVQVAFDEYGPDGAGPAYVAIAGPALAGVIALTALRLRTAPGGRIYALALGAAGLAAFILPFFEALATGPMRPALEFVLGGFVFAAGAVLILIGSGPGRRTAGAVGVVLFTAQSIYVYAELFSGLLGTAAFFFVGGVLMIALSVILTRIARRLGRESTP